MITVCHYCHQVFAAKETEVDLEIVIYVSLVAESMGVYREDTYKTYMQLNDLKLILEDIGPHIESAPFEKEKIINTLQSVFVKQGA